jgi:uncharacterized SAM-binding protein YcdF (DUF218 family)
LEDFRRPPEQEVEGASAAVVFTGSFDRIDVGLRLLASGSVTRLFISGVNGAAGLNPDSFVEQFSARNPDIVDLPQIVKCCVELGQLANDTVQNALETGCWLRRAGLADPILLITSKDHMARALLALSASLPGRSFLPYPSDGDASTSRDVRPFAERLKYLGTLVYVHSPWLPRALQLEGGFKNGCPA